MEVEAPEHARTAVQGLFVSQKHHVAGSPSSPDLSVGGRAQPGGQQPLVQSATIHIPIHVQRSFSENPPGGMLHRLSGRTLQQSPEPTRGGPDLCDGQEYITLRDIMEITYS